MAISYPLTLPTTIDIATIVFTARNTVGLTQSPFTLKQQVQRNAGQRWEATVTLPPMSRDEAEEWISFLLKLNGSFGTFLMGDPNGKLPRGAAISYPSDVIAINGAGQTGNTLNLDGATASISDYVKAGDYIQIGGASTANLYKALNDADSNSSGELTLDIWPNLRSSPTDGSAISGQNAVAQFRLANNQTGFSINEASIYGLSFTAVEAL